MLVLCESIRERILSLPMSDHLEHEHIVTWGVISYARFDRSGIQHLLYVCRIPLGTRSWVYEVILAVD